MIKLYKDFFDSDCLDYIEKEIEKGKLTANLKTSYPSSYWSPDIIHDSAPVMIFDMSPPDMLLNRLNEVIDTTGQVNFMIYYWPGGSYIPWHTDEHTPMTATLYCNRIWDRNWGGLFLYEEEDKILAEVPEWNKLVIQTDSNPHSTTSVTKPYYTPMMDDDGKLNVIPIIRTTIQIFEINEKTQSYLNKRQYG